MSSAIAVKTKKDFVEDEYDASNIEVIIEALQEMVSYYSECNLLKNRVEGSSNGDCFPFCAVIFGHFFHQILSKHMAQPFMFFPRLS